MQFFTRQINCQKIQAEKNVVKVILLLKLNLFFKLYQKIIGNNFRRKTT